jgi:hypothetical protein
MPQPPPGPPWRTIRIGRGKNVRTVKVRIVPKRGKRDTPERPQ